MKKTFYGIMFTISLIMLMSESDNLMAQVLWPSAAFILFAISGKALSNLIKEEE